MKTKMPSIVSIRRALADCQRSLRRSCNRSDLLSRDSDGAFTDVRLQVYPSGNWAVHTGLSDYDQDHRGYWGASCLSYDRQNLTDLARELIDQCAEQAAYDES